MTNGNEAPGDEAAPGTPGTGENLCRNCNGTGEQEGKPCPVCDGTGKVTEGLAGG
jgi:DnaJ-class molecular chaperone